MTLPLSMEAGEVTQADREAAKQLAAYAGFQWSADHLDMAIDAAAQAFARHRIASRPTLSREVIARIVSGFPQRPQHSRASAAVAIWDDALAKADAIIALIPEAPVASAGGREAYAARPVAGEPWVWEIWDVEHPHPGNHFPVLRIDSKGASDDFHEEIAAVRAKALNARWHAQSTPGSQPALKGGADE